MNMRLEHICEQIREVLSTALAFEMRDPAFEGVTITRVRVSPDYQYADVRFSTYDEKDRSRVEAGFARAKGALRSLVAKRVLMKSVPQLRFHYDDDVAAERRIGRILEELHVDGEPLET